MSGPARCEDRILICVGPVTHLGREDNRHKGRDLYQGASEGGAVPAADSGVDYTASRQASGDSVQDSRSDPQQSGLDFSGHDSFRESRQQDSGRFQRQDADFSRRGDQELSGSGGSGGFRCFGGRQYKCGETPGRHRMHQHGNKYQQRFQEAAKAEEPQEKQPGSAEGEPKRPSKLEFTADELPPEAADKKRPRRGAGPSVWKKSWRMPKRVCLPEKTADGDSFRPGDRQSKKRLKFEQEVKSQRAHVKGSLPMRPVKVAANTAAGYAHKKIYQAEEEKYWRESRPPYRACG